MLYELTTYDLRPRTLPTVEAALGEAYAAAGKPKELIGSFRTEFGPLNQIIQIHRYEDHAHRDRAGAGPRVLAGMERSVIAITTELMAPTAISPVLEPGRLGPYYELRTYTFPPGELDKLVSAWRRAMPMRDALGCPVAAIWTGVVGAMNTLTHIWPYPSLQEREAIRVAVRKEGLWPPYKLDEAEGGGGYEILTQQNKLLLPAPFSPLQ